MQPAYFLAGGVILGAGITYFLMHRRMNVQDHLKAIGEEILAAAKEKLGAEKEVIKVDLEGKKDAIKTLVDEIRLQLKETDRNLRKSDEDRISNFSALRKELETHKQLASDLRGSTDELKNILSNNQTRGQFGERIAEDLLKMAGFVINHDYFVQTAGGDGRPDFTLVLPDQTKVNIDVKFPYQNLQKYTEAKDPEEKKRHFDQFQRDVREKIKQISTRGYVNPDDNTVDFAVAFIPNEMIFSFIYEHFNDIWEEAMNKKVILAGPYSFVALLRLVKQAHSNFKLQTNIHSIIQLVQKFRQEYGKFSEELDTLGSRLDSTSKQFQVVSSTRHRQLGRVMDQIDNQHVLDDKSQNSLLD
ncbi:MAG TPA: DNA recombination protein RmuC [Candidatus Saccharimonadales bacterium]|nr:DNA recombination protein RmuC [Candidatus Saccharimonadales bacterium]